MKGKNLITVLVFITILLTTICAGVTITPIKAPSVTISRFDSSSSTTVIPWPMFQHDPQHTGYTTSKIPTTVQQKWNFTTLGTGAVKTAPVIDNGMVFAGSDDGNFYALDQNTGAIEWFRSIGASTNHPAVDSSKELVFIGVGSILYALNETDGTTDWTKLEPSGETWYSPAIFDSEQDLLFIGGTLRQGYAGRDFRGALYSKYETDGTENWTSISGTWTYTPYGGDRPYIHTSPAVAFDSVYVGSDQGTSSGFNFWRSNETTGQKLRERTFSKIRSSPTIAWEKVLFGCDDGNLYALNAVMLETTWLRTTGGSIHSSPAVDEAQGLVFIGSDDGKLHCFTKIGADVWQHDFGQPVQSSPAVGDGKVLIAVGNTLYCLDETTGEEIWQYQTGGTVTSPAVADGTIFIGSTDGYIYALTGSVEKVDTTVDFWFQLTPPVNPGDNVVLQGTLLDENDNPVTSADVKIEYSFDLVTWHYVWTLTTDGSGDFSQTFTAPGVGTYYVRSSYAGSAVYNPSSDTETLTVISPSQIESWIYIIFTPNPTSPGQTVTLKGILIDDSSKPIGSAEVTIRYSTDHGATWHSIWTLKTNQYGIFSQLFTAPGAGTYLVQASYAGSSTYMSSTSNAYLVVL